MIVGIGGVPLHLASPPPPPTHHFCHDVAAGGQQCHHCQLCHAQGLPLCVQPPTYLHTHTAAPSISKPGHILVHVGKAPTLVLMHWARLQPCCTASGVTHCGTTGVMEPPLPVCHCSDDHSDEEPPLTRCIHQGTPFRCHSLRLPPVHYNQARAAVPTWVATSRVATAAQAVVTHSSTTAGAGQLAAHIKGGIGRLPVAHWCAGQPTNSQAASHSHSTSARVPRAGSTMRHTCDAKICVTA